MKRQEREIQTPAKRRVRGALMMVTTAGGAVIASQVSASIAAAVLVVLLVIGLNLAVFLLLSSPRG